MKVQTAFRLESDLLDRLKLLAKEEKRSLNNFVEVILSDVVNNVPNDVTKKAIRDAEEGINLSPITDLKLLRDSILKDV